ncbi:phage terminase large subunit [Paenibacillus nicotianae]|uniref:Phage terminase large subunit n=1 Tax=Paenibacillus nicotianae TaxID=1526551 RepID=A0ABW4URY7_9BACL
MLNPSQMTQIQAEASKELARRDFSYFMDYDSDFRDRPGKHLDLLDETLMKVSSGEIRRLIVTMPPRHGKSERVSKKFPAWHLGNHPNDELIIASYSIDLCRGFTRIARDTLSKNEDVFGVFIDPEKRSAEEWGIKDTRGACVAAGVGGGVTGKGARIAIIDDPVKNSEEANSQVMRDKVYEWYESTLFTRLTPDGRVIIVMTRWHEDDLVGRLLRKQKEDQANGELQDDPWTVINFPAIAEDNDILGRKINDPLWPEYGFDKKVMKRIKNQVGSYVFNSLYQQRPSSASGSIFKREHFQYFSEETIYNIAHFVMSDGRRFEKNRCWCFQTIDTANSIKTINDYFVVTTIYVTPDNDILIGDVYRTHIEGPEQKQLLKEMFIRFRPKFQAIENITFGTNLIQECIREGMTIRPIKVDKDKVTRSLPMSARYEVKKVYHKAGTTWLDDFETEMMSFPRGAHDDQVDTISMAGEIVYSIKAEEISAWVAAPTSKSKRAEAYDEDDDEDDVQQNSFWSR